MTHNDYQERLAAYALDALDPVDSQALGEHLSNCMQCRDELIGLRDTSALLAHAATAQAPGDRVRAQIVSRVRAEAAPTPAQVVQMPVRGKTVWPNVLRLAAAIAFVALLAGVIVLWRRDSRLQREIARLSRRVDTQQNQMERDRDLMAQQKEALVLLTSANAKKIELNGTQVAQNARATVMFDEKTGRAMLFTQGLPALAADKAYEVWFIPKGHAPMPGKVFIVDPSGHAMIADQMPPEAMNNAVIAITIEPKSGSAAPTGAIYLASRAS